jgi:hypothetical protein
MSSKVGTYPWRVKKLPSSLKVPEISRTSPSGQKEDYEEYSVEASAAIRHSLDRRISHPSLSILQRLPNLIYVNKKIEFNFKPFLAIVI